MKQYDFEKILNEFYDMLSLKLAEKLDDGDIEKLDAVIMEINKEAENFDFNSLKTLEDLDNYINNVFNKIVKTFEDKIPNFEEFFLDVWQEYLEKLI